MIPSGGLNHRNPLLQSYGGEKSGWVDSAGMIKFGYEISSYPEDDNLLKWKGEIEGKCFLVSVFLKGTLKSS